MTLDVNKKNHSGLRKIKIIDQDKNFVVMWVFNCGQPCWR